MENAPYFIFAALCFLFSIGLQKRTIWMWYLGWVLLFLYAGFTAEGSFFMLYDSVSVATQGLALGYLLGKIFLWGIVTYWWATHRHVFGGRRGTQQKRAGTDMSKSPGA